MRRKKWMAGLLVLTMGLGLAACGSKSEENTKETESTAEAETQMNALAESLMENTKNFEVEKFGAYLPEDEEGYAEMIRSAASADGSELTRAFCDYWTEKAAGLTWTVQEIDSQTNTAQVVCTYVDSTEFLSEYMMLQIAMESTAETEEEADQEYAQLMQQAADMVTEESYLTKTILITFSEESGVWKIDRVSDEFLDVASAGLVTANNNWNDQMGGNTEEEQTYEAVKESLRYEVKEGWGGMIVELESDSELTDVHVDLDMTFYDAQGDFLSSAYAELNYLTPGSTQYAILSPESEYASYELELTTSKAYMDPAWEDLELSWEDTGDGISYQITNTGDSAIDVVTLAGLYYEGDEAIGGLYAWEYDLAAGESRTGTIEAPVSYAGEEPVSAYDVTDLYLTACCYNDSYDDSFDPSLADEDEIDEEELEDLEAELQDLMGDSYDEMTGEDENGNSITVYY